MRYMKTFIIAISISVTSTSNCVLGFVLVFWPRHIGFCNALFTQIQNSCCLSISCNTIRTSVRSLHCIDHYLLFLHDINQSSISVYKIFYELSVIYTHIKMRQSISIFDLL